MDAPVPVIVAALLAAAGLVLPGARGRALAMLGTLALTPVILLAHIWETEQLEPLRDRPGLGLGLAGAGLVVVAALAIAFARRPSWLPVAVVATLPFRVPVASGGSTANLLVPLYLVVVAGALAYAVPRVAGRAQEAPERRAGALEWALAAVLALYAVQATGSDDFDRALENVVFFYVPFALLFALLARVTWTPRLATACLGLLAAMAVVLAGVGFVEYVTRHLFLNPKVIASNQVEDSFRVNSLFFDPNIFGRFLALVMLLLAAWLAWARRPRDVAVAGLLLAVLWGGLLLTLSQSSFAALLAGLAVLGGLRWSPRLALALSVAALALGAGFVAVAPDAVRVDLGDSASADAATSGRAKLIEGGVGLFTDEPLLGHGSGSFAREYRRAEDASAGRATSASHTTPITVAAEQGVVGLAAYLALLAAAFTRLFRGARGLTPRAAIAACFTALVAHSLLYAAFLEDPLTWALLAVGSALAAAPGRTPEERAAAAEGRRAAGVA